MKKLLLMLGVAVVLAVPAMAWRPSGWVYVNGPYVYEPSSGNWHWFNTGDAQWVVNLNSNRWSVLGLSPAPSGMVIIPSGKNEGVDADFGEYRLEFNSFYMDRNLVTKELWDEVYNWAIINGYEFENPGSAKDVGHPVHSVSWYDCLKWCNARSEKSELEPTYYTDELHTQAYRTGRHIPYVKGSAVGFRLPHVDEWEYAARGGAGNRRFTWRDADDIQHARANYRSDETFGYDTSPTRGYHPTYNDGTEPYTSPVGSFPANDFGLYDMTGNLWDWCFDETGSDGWRAVRGGCWYNLPDYCRVGHESGGWMNYAGDLVGFRTVLKPIPYVAP